MIQPEGLTKPMQDLDPTTSQAERLKVYQQYEVPVSLDSNPVTCGDQGGLEGIRVFGGAENFVYNLDILRESVEPGSVTSTFVDSTSSIVPTLISLGVKPNVHSDDASENGDTYQPELEEGAVGCKYVQYRQAISAYIGSHAEEILAEAQSHRPELLTTEDATQIATDIIAAHARLAARDSYYEPGSRKVIKTASENGAEVAMVHDRANATDVVLTTKPHTDIDTAAAKAAGNPVYAHNSWAVGEIFDLLDTTYPYGQQRTRIADIIDTIGVTKLLEIDLIVNRPELDAA